MSSILDSKNSDFAIHRVVVNNLKEDGVICDAYTKEYDEQKTFEGGTGNRLAFKNYNDKVKNYHKILKNLTGESRANISETIPVIDFAHTENTTFMATYPFKNGSATEIDPTTSIDIISDSNSASEETPAIDYITDEDGSIINRALAGENMAEHFYNTRGDAIQDANIQVSPWDGDKAVIYRGIETPTVLDLDTGESLTAFRHDTIKVHKAETSEWININPLFAGEYDSENNMAPLEHEILDEKGNTMAALTSICNGVHFLTATDNAEVELDVKVPKRKRDPEGNILYDDRGRPLIEPPDPNTGDYDKEALKVPIHTNFTVKLVKDDIVVVLPSNSYNSDPCRLLLFKANYSASPDSYQGTNSNGKYFFYVLELNTYDASAEFTDVAYEEVMPEYIDDNNILDFINDYAKCEREYYTKASGLMDGYFCEPHEWQDMGDYRTVTKWKMSSDVDTAAERGIPIDVGSRYFRGHLLGRGEFLDQPFGTTEPEEANYQGKATYFYDAIQNSAGALLDNVTIPYEEWQTRAGSQVVALDGVVSKGDYVGSYSEYGENIDPSTYKDLFGVESSGFVVPATRVAYASKFIKEDGTVASYSDFQNYIDSCREHLFADEENEAYVFYADLRSDVSACWRQVVTVTKGKDAQKIDMNDTGKAGPNNRVYDTFEKIYYMDITANVENKDASDDEMGTLDLTIGSPVNVFAPSGGANTFLLYPEYNKFFPEELYLISKNKLPLEEYDANPESNTLGMCSFYNKNEDKVICFKVDEVIAFLPSKISKVQLWIPTYDHKSEINYSYSSKHGTADDCYIYVLKPMELNASNIELKGPDRQPISFEAGVNGLKIMAMSYPSTYFPMSIDNTEGTARYVINEANRATDLKILKNSYIIAGLPDYQNPDDFYKMSAGSAFDLSIFGRMLSDENGMGALLQKVLKAILASVISNWPMSDSTTNPMVFADLPYVLEGLIELQPELTTLLNAQFNIPYVDPDTGNLKTITEADLWGLNKRIDYKDSYLDYQYEAEINKDLEDWNFTADEPFSEIINKRLDCITYTVSDKSSMSRPSIRELKAIVDSGLNDGDFTRPDCQKLDSYFGNGTTAFLKMGEDATVRTTPASMKSLSKQLSILAEDIIKETDSQYKYMLRILTEAEEYGKYYTKESMYECFGVKYVGKVPEFADDTEEGTETQSLTRAGGDDTTEDVEIPDNASDWEYDGSSGILTPDYSKLVIDYNGTVLDDEGKPKKDKDGNTLEYSAVDSYLVNLLGDPKGLNNGGPTLISDSKTLNFKEIKDKYELYQPEALTTLDADVQKGRNFLIDKVQNWVNGISALSTENKSEGTEYQPLTTDEITAYATSKLDPVEEEKPEEGEEPTTPEEPTTRANGDETIEDYVQSTRLEVREVDNHDGTFSIVVDFRLPDLKQIKQEVAVTTVNEAGDVSIVGTKEEVLDPVMKLVESDLNYHKVVHTYTKNLVDVSTEVLQGVADFVKTNLEGTGDASYYVRYVQGDEKVTGRENSLYYKRYQMLNNRMNKTQGPLAMAARFLNAESMFKELNSYQDGLVESYKKFVKVSPISSMKQLSYFPPQEASGTTIQMEGKFYYQEELDELRKLINNKCVLTCNYCEVKDSCPFYNEEEVLKLYCDEAPSIDVYLKDNELDLLYYDEDPNNLSPYLVYTSADNGDSEILDHKYLQKMHKEYSDILKKLDAQGQVDASYVKRDLEGLRTQLRNILPDYEEETRGGLGFLLNGRYGTLQVNDLSALADPTSSMTNPELDVEEIPKYKTMYDALFFEDEETEFLYTASQHKYPVTLSIGPYGSKKVYRGTTRIKIPANIKLLAEANPGDDLYLVSDDEVDATGKSIIPVIYINKVKNVIYSFDLTDNGTDEEITDANDTALYAKDVAQWSINISKGWCLDDPLGSHEDKYLDYDQYWMSTIRKPVTNSQGITSYITLSGRSRANTGYQEPVIDAENYDETMAISGKPVVNPYINYTRKFMISMDCVQWVKPNSTIYPDLSYENKVETQKSTLPLMTTNLRLVLVKNRAVDTSVLPECEEPVITQEEDLISITCSIENSTIYYRIGPSGSYEIYTGPFEIKSSTTIYAYATAVNYEASDTVRFVCSYGYQDQNTKLFAPEMTQSVNNNTVDYTWANWADYEGYTTNPEASIVFEWCIGEQSFTTSKQNNSYSLEAVIENDGYAKFRVRDLNGFYKDSKEVTVNLPTDIMAPKNSTLAQPMVNVRLRDSNSFVFTVSNQSAYDNCKRKGDLVLIASYEEGNTFTQNLDGEYTLSYNDWNSKGNNSVQFYVEDKNKFYQSSPIKIVNSETLFGLFPLFPALSDSSNWTWNLLPIINLEFEGLREIPDGLVTEYVTDSMNIGADNVSIASSISEETGNFVINLTLNSYGILDVKDEEGNITEDSVVEELINHYFLLKVHSSGYGERSLRFVFSKDNFIDTYVEPKCENPVITQNENTISITCSTDKSKIWYRIGSTGEYREYTAPFEILETVVIYAYSEASGYEQSDIIQKQCTLYVPEPEEPEEEEKP